MLRTLAKSLTLIGAFFLWIPSSFGQAPVRPLSRIELMALVAGKTVPENVVFEIDRNGIGFVPDRQFRSLLQDAGAQPKVLLTLDEAKPPSVSGAEPASELASLTRLSKAGRFAQSGEYDSAINELAATLKDASTKSAAGYVMGHILIDQGRDSEALAVYTKILAIDPNFPGVHTRLSYLYFNVGEIEEALRQAQAALVRNPNDPVAHLNAGASYERLNKFDAARSELDRSVRSKPDYALAYAAIGHLQLTLNDFDGAVEHYKKALALEPNDNPARVNLAVAYSGKNDLDSAIREYRDILRRDPNMLVARENLAAVLAKRDPASAIEEYRKLVAAEPNSSICHACFGAVLTQVGNLSEAEAEYRKAIKVNPSDPSPHLGLGWLKERKTDYEGALEEFLTAVSLDNSSALAHKNVVRILLIKRDFKGALAEGKLFQAADPVTWESYHFMGQAMEGLGDTAGAIAEYKEALRISPKEISVRLDLANVYEKTGDWPDALRDFRQAEIDEAPWPGLDYGSYQAELKYRAASSRFDMYLSKLRSSGQEAEAAALEAKVEALQPAKNRDLQYRDAMQASADAFRKWTFDIAEVRAKEAIAIAEAMQPTDVRLVEALGQLARTYYMHGNVPAATETYRRQLLEAQRLYGSESPRLTLPLQDLAFAMSGNDSAEAEQLLLRAVAINRKTFGENSEATGNALQVLALRYEQRQDFLKAEKSWLEFVKINETMFGSSSPKLSYPLTCLCAMYDKWGKQEKAKDCHDRLSALAAK